MRSRWQDLPTPVQDDDNWCHISDLQSYAATTDDGLEGEIVAESDEADDEIDKKDDEHGAEGDAESFGDVGEVGRPRNAFIAGHGPEKAGASEVGATYDEKLIA
jgi:hypothetical protein